MAPNKKARTGQGANVTPVMVVDSIIDDVGEHQWGEDIPPVTTLPGFTITSQAAPVPTPGEGTMNILTDILDPLPAPSFGPGVSDEYLRGAIQMLAQIVASQVQRSNISPTSSSQQGDSIGSMVNRFL